MSNEMTMANNVPQNYSVGMTEVEARQLAEIRGKMVLAKQFPRSTQESLSRILMECENPKLAESAVYSFPRGDSEVTGPSIRLAEVIASNWGNFTCGVTELEQKDGESVVKAYAWDVETNYSDEKVFTVKHFRSTKKGGYKLTDPRDIYELVANQGARRKRGCIFSVIPTYLVDAAVEKCKEVLENEIACGDIVGVRNKMLEAFTRLDEKITKEILEEKIAKEFDKFNAKDIARLKRLYGSINDGFVKPHDAFNLGIVPTGETYLNEEDTAKMDELNKIMQGEPEKVKPDKRKTKAKVETSKNEDVKEPTEEENTKTLTDEEKEAIIAQEILEAEEEQKRENEIIGVDYE